LRQEFHYVVYADIELGSCDPLLSLPNSRDYRDITPHLAVIFLTHCLFKVFNQQSSSFKGYLSLSYSPKTFKENVKKSRKNQRNEKMNSCLQMLSIKFASC
jgi:hypothetical protein